MDHLSEIMPPEVSQNPMGQMFVVFMREAKKDLRRLPEPFIQSLSKVIGDAFTWVATGEIDSPPSIDAEIDELLANV